MLNGDEIKVDLLVWGGEISEFSWSLGELWIGDRDLLPVDPSLGHALRSEASHILFWHRDGGPPPADKIRKLAATPMDAWHGGLKLGLQGAPSCLNFLEPTWIYHKDAPLDRVHSSFRISLRACLIRRELVEDYMSTHPTYTQVEALGLDMGYYLWKSGALIRYSPDLVSHPPLEQVVIEEDQQWQFVCRFYGRKWRLWYALQSGNYFRIAEALVAGLPSPLRPRPRIHASQPELKALRRETISVLAPTLNRYPYLERELEQMDAQDLAPLEILVTDQTPENQRKRPAYRGQVPLRYFPQEDSGQCIAWNRLLEEARGQWVLFLGDDADQIAPDFLDRLLGVQQFYQADMVAAFVEEAGIHYEDCPPYRSISDSFPICLVRRTLLEETGYMDMFFNRTIRADHDLAMRCHMAGALMIHDAGIRVFHHRAPMGGLRTHRARVITRNMSRKSWRVFVGPTASEIYLAAKYFPWPQVRQYLWIKYLGQLSMDGNLFSKGLRLLAFLFYIPRFVREYRIRSREAREALDKNKEKRWG